MRQQQSAQLRMSLAGSKHQQRPSALIPGFDTTATIEIGLHKLNGALGYRKAQ